MPLDRDFEAILNDGAARDIPPETMTVEEARSRERVGLDPGAGEPVGSVEDMRIPTEDGPVSIRLYRPAGTGPFPVLVCFHSGGFVLGSLDTYDGLCRMLTNAARCLTVSVAYRLAPEHPFPAAVDDCIAATRWVAAHADEVGGDASRLAVGGNSAGGNLAAVVAQMARNGGPAIRFQWLIYPILDRPGTTPSYKEFGEGYQLTRPQMDYYWRLYLPDRQYDRDPRAAPLQAADLSGLPPALIVTAEYDPLRDEGERYARRLQSAGVPVRLVRYDGMIHGFFGLAARHGGARAALLEAAATLCSALS